MVGYVWDDESCQPCQSCKVQRQLFCNVQNSDATSETGITSEVVCSLNVNLKIRSYSRIDVAAVIE